MLRTTSRFSPPSASDIDAAPAPPRPMAGGEHGRQVRDPERPRLSSAPIGGGPPIAGQHPGRPLAGRNRLPGQLRAEARRVDRHRGARRGAPRVVQLFLAGESFMLTAIIGNAFSSEKHCGKGGLRRAGVVEDPDPAARPSPLMQGLQRVARAPDRGSLRPSGAGLAAQVD